MGIKYLDPPSKGGAEQPTAQAPGTGPTAGQSLRRGLLAEGPANMAGLADLLINRLDPRRRAAQGMATQLPPSDIAGQVRSNMLSKDASGQFFGPPPTAPSEKFIQGLGAGVTESIPFALVPEAGAVRVGRALTELGTGAASEAVRATAEASGAGPGAQFGTSLLAALGARGFLGVGAKLGRTAGRLLPSINAIEASRTAARVLGEEVPNRAVAIKLLDEEINRPLFGRATTEQALAETSPGLSGLMTRETINPGLRKEVSDLQKYNALATADFGRANFKAGQVSAAQEAYAQRLTAIRAKVTKAYNNVGDLEGIPVDKLDAAAAWVRNAAAGDLALERRLPTDQLKTIENYQRVTGYVSSGPGPLGGATNVPVVSREASFKQLQKLRSGLIADADTARTAGDRQKLFYINKLMDSVEQTFNDVAEAGGARDINALRNAQRIRRIEGERFNPKNPLNRILGSEFEDTGKAFNRFLASPMPSSALLTARRTLGDNPRAWAGVQRLMRDHVFGEDFQYLFGNLGSTTLSEKGATRAMKNLFSNRAAFDVVYGPGATENAANFIRRVRTLSSGSTPRIERLSFPDIQSSRNLDQVGVVSEIWTRNPARAAIRAFRYATGRLPNSQSEADRLLGAAVVDPEVAKGFFEVLPPGQLPTWRARLVRALESDVIKSAEGSRSQGDLMVEAAQNKGQ